MAGSACSAIDLVDLTQVCGGGDKHTQAARMAIAAATNAMKDVARATVPKDDSLTQMMIQALASRGSGPGPTPAPALPPTSTLTR